MPSKSKQLASLATKPTRVRLAKARGASSQPRVDREGGKYGAGKISGVSVITKGEALGHYLWIDDVFLDQVDEAGNELAGGLKSRWTHPGMSSDGLGKVTSRLFEFTRDGEQVFADQHFLKIGHKTPDGDLAAYQMDLADEDPASYGLSIVFELDYGAMHRFSAENEDEDGNFVSPDAANTNHFAHARLAALYAADAVDEPAANPSGLFARKHDIAREADQLCAFALGLSDERPEVVQLGLDADRARAFATRFLTTHQLKVTAMKKGLTEGSTNPSDDQATDADNSQPAGEGGESTETTSSTSETSTEPAPVAAGSRAEAQKFRKLFGAAGLEYFADGLSLEEAQAKFNAGERESINARLEKLENQLKAGAQVSGEAKPVGFQAGDEKPEKKGLAGKIRIAGAAPAQK